MYIYNKKVVKSLLSLLEEESEETKNDITENLYEYVNGTMLYNDLLDADPFIYDITSWTSDKFSRKIIFKVSMDDFYEEELGLSENDKYFLDVMMGNGYFDYQFEDYYTLTQDFLDGNSRPVYYFDDENKQLLEKISSYLLPQKKFNFDSENFNKELNNILYGLYENEIESILQEFYYGQENAYYESIKDTIQKKFIGPIKDKMGFIFEQGKVGSPIYNLIMQARLLDYEGDLKGLYDEIVEKYSKVIDVGWGDDYYNYYDDQFFDSESYNKYVNDKLNEIIDDIENGEQDIRGFVNFVKNVTKIADIDNWTRLPKNPSYQYRVVEFDKDNMKVLTQIATPKGVVTRKLSEEGFYNLLYHPELFDLST